MVRKTQLAGGVSKHTLSEVEKAHGASFAGSQVRR